jgi:hypothetical protein
VETGQFNPPAGVDPVRDLISDRIADYYNLVASKEDGAAGLRPVDDVVTMYQAFVNLGMPRAKTNDDQLQALLFGTHAIPADLPRTPETPSQTGKQPSLVMSSIYAEAAQAVRANKYQGALPISLLTDGNEGDPPIDCRPFTQAGRDGLGDCVRSVANQRADRLYSRIATHFQAIAGNAESTTSPLVQEAMDNLRLEIQWAKARMTP